MRTPDWINKTIAELCNVSSGEVPNYCEDRNALYKAEIQLGLLGNDFRGRKLRRMWHKEMNAIKTVVDPAFATSQQLAEVLLKIHNKW